MSGLYEEEEKPVNPRFAQYRQLIASTDLIITNNEPIITPRSVAQTEKSFKPAGLWYGIGDSWLEWLESEKSDWVGKYLHKIELAPTANILHLTSPGDIHNLTYKFGDKSGTSYAKYCIDWPRIAAMYDGIEISPYQWSCRLSVLWYYPWDCASGCIWSSHAIERIVRLE